MFYIILNLLLSFFSPSHSGNGNHNSGEQVTTLEDTGGETGTIPPRRIP